MPQGYPVRSALSSYQYEEISLLFRQCYDIRVLISSSTNIEIYTRNLIDFIPHLVYYRNDQSPNTHRIWTTKGRFREECYNLRYPFSKPPLSTRFCFVSCLFNPTLWTTDRPRVQKASRFFLLNNCDIGHFNFLIVFRPTTNFPTHLRISNTNSYKYFRLLSNDSRWVSE